MFNGDKLYMLPSVTPLQCMGFVLAGKGDVLAVDGGTAAETDQLENLLLSLGGKVTCWLLTHAHFDHIEALIGVLERGNVEIGRICYQFPDSEYIERVERQENRTARAADLENAIARRAFPSSARKKDSGWKRGISAFAPFRRQRRGRKPQSFERRLPRGNERRKRALSGRYGLARGRKNIAGISRRVALPRRADGASRSAGRDRKILQTYLAAGMPVADARMAVEQRYRRGL